MRALLLKPWGGYQPGQVLTAYEPGSIPTDTAVWYGDDERIPTLHVINGAIDPHAPELAGRVGSLATPAAPTGVVDQAQDVDTRRVHRVRRRKSKK